MGNLRISYAGLGVDASSGVNLTFQRGITPSVCQITMKANISKSTLSNALDADGGADLILDDGIDTVTTRMWIDGDIEEQENKNGTFLNITLKDRRWKWKYGYYTKIANQPDKSGLPPGGAGPNNVDAETLIGDARGNIGDPGDEDATTFDVTNAPSTVYPPIEYEGETPAQVIQDICENTGLCVCLRTKSLTTQLAKIEELGDVVGAPLPTGKYEEEITTTPTYELPSKIVIFGARKVEEDTFTDWEAVGMDTAAKNHDVKPINDLSYAPDTKWPGQGLTWMLMLKDEFTLYTDEEEKKLAKKCIYKWYRWNPPPITGKPNPADNKTTQDIRNEYLPWLNMRAKLRKSTVGTPPLTENERDDPYLTGVYVIHDPKNSGKPFTDIVSAKEMVDGWSIDVEHGIIKFSKKIIKRSAAHIASKKDSWGWDTATAPDLNLTIAYEVPLSNAEPFYIYELDLTAGPHEWPTASNCGPFVVKKSELVLYSDQSGPLNDTELEAFCDTIAPLIKKQLWDEIEGTAKTYIGIKDVSPDGAISSVTWNISSAGATTTIQRGRDKPPPFIPTYKTFMAQLRQKRQAARNSP